MKSTDLNILNVSIPLGLESPLIYTTPQYADGCSYRISSPGGSRWEVTFVNTGLDHFLDGNVPWGSSMYVIGPGKERVLLNNSAVKGIGHFG